MTFLGVSLDHVYSINPEPVESTHPGVYCHYYTNEHILSSGLLL